MAWSSREVFGGRCVVVCRMSACCGGKLSFGGWWWVRRSTAFTGLSHQMSSKASSHWFDASSPVRTPSHLILRLMQIDSKHTKPAPSDTHL